MNASIQSKCDELVAAIRASILEDIGAALKPVRQVAGLRGLNGARAKRIEAWRTRAEAAADRRSGEKRSPNAIAGTVNALLAAINAEPGRRIEEIATRMGEPTRDLVLPVKKLLAAKQIKKTGARRATRYFPRSK